MFFRISGNSSWRAASVILLSWRVLFGQSAAPSFEAADVHVSPPAPHSYTRGGLTDGGIWELRFATMIDLISFAWNVDEATIASGPSWLGWNRFDVTAKVPEGATAETVRPMLRTLLADRFKLAVRPGEMPMPAFILTAGPKPLLKPSSGSGESGCDAPDGRYTVKPDGMLSVTYICRNLTLNAFATGMNRMSFVLRYTNNLLVVDKTGINGAWDFNLTYGWRTESASGAAPSRGDVITLQEAITKQLGLRLNPGQAPAPVLVVDHAEEVPAPNPPGTEKALPAAPSSFEVAVLKPSDPDSTATKFEIANGGVQIRGIPLSALIHRIWGLENPDEIAGIPDWARSARFDITAKAPVAPDPAPVRGVRQDLDRSYAMIRGLLTDRFQIKTHFEDRPINAFVLLPGKAKMKRADPAGRTLCNEGPGPDGKDPRIENPAISRLITCTNVTMAQFGELLPNQADDYVDNPVLDKTGLTGGWNFTLYFSDARTVRGGLSNSDGAASDPTGAISLEEAIDKQLGLKLKPEKRMAKVLVIDHIDRNPADN